MSIKNVVKVMNFHALLRVDSAKRNAEKYFLLEEELSKMIDTVLNNRNFILDKKTMAPAKDKPVLEIFIGSDFGFCSNYNSQVNTMLRKELAEGREDVQRVLIGKKLRYSGEDALLRMTKADFLADSSALIGILEDSVRHRRHREIHIIYNHYYNASEINIEKKQIFPVQLRSTNPEDYTDDFVVEADVNELLKSLLAYYVVYELKICIVNANAAENVLRQNTTNESLKKIDERDELYTRTVKKEKRAKDFRKIIERFAKKPG